MSDYVVRGLDPARFSGQQPFQTVIADESPGFPCRVTLEDAAVDDEVCLLAYRHNGGTSPYAQTGPVFVRADALVPDFEPPQWTDSLPEVLTRRWLSLRAYDSRDVMVDAALIEGRDAPDTVRRLLENSAVDRIDAHFALRGCFAAHIRRA